MKIMITGAAGGIGSTLGYHLNKKGHDLILVDNLRNGYTENLTIEGKKFGKFYHMDINSDDFHNLVLSELPDSIIHLAAITSLPDCEVNYRECIRINVEGTASVLGAARKAGVTNVIFGSTSAVYEKTELDESSGFKETDETCPRLLYSLSKKMAEEICQSFIENYGMNIITLRFFNVFGPRQDIYRKSPPLMNYIFREMLNKRSPILHSDGNQTRDYVYVDDVVEIIERFTHIKNTNSNHTFNVSSNTTISVKEIVSSISYSIGGYQETSEVYRDSEKLWDSYPDLYQGSFPLKKEIVIKETNKKSKGNNDLLKNFIGIVPSGDIKGKIGEMSKLIIDHFKPDRNKQ